MKLTFLGTGTSQGIPIIACQCNCCQSSDSKDKRLRSSVYIETETVCFNIDCGPDFRQQMLRERISKLDAILFTHDHKDHTGGLDDVRAFNYVQKKYMEVYAESNVLETLKKEFSYAFKDHKYPGVPRINLNPIINKSFVINGLEIEPIRGKHMALDVLGFRIGKLAYITDMNFISASEMKKLENLDVLIINALRHEKHISHFNYEEALGIIKQTKVKKAYLTHISHDLGTDKEMSPRLPNHVYLAYDGLKIEF